MSTPPPPVPVSGTEVFNLTLLGFRTCLLEWDRLAPNIPDGQPKADVARLVAAFRKPLEARGFPPAVQRVIGHREREFLNEALKTLAFWLQGWEARGAVTPGTVFTEAPNWKQDPKPDPKPDPKRAERLIQEATQAVGGPVAWSRLGYDAKIDAVRARAWVNIQSRADGVDQAVPMADVYQAMLAVYGRENL